VTPRNLTEEKARTELSNVRIIAVAGGHEANGAADISIQPFFLQRKNRHPS